MTRHPVSGAARERRVRARELVETRAAKFRRCFASNRRRTHAGELVDSSKF